LLSVENIHTYYDNIHALKGINLTVEQGEIVCLIGNNGAGKTTALKTIMGVLAPEEGTITFNGQKIVGRGTDKIVASGLSLVPEGRQIFPVMTVLENLQLGAYTRQPAESKSSLEQVYELFPRLYDRRKQAGGTLSGGEQQMLAIGRALMAKPKLLLLDEPSLGLSPILVETIFELIGRINQQGITILLIEQNARLALQISSRGYVLETGQVVMNGKASDLAESEEVKKAYLGE
jgi:branched-chain amino acid transport system ATP-binding protein